MSGEASGVIGGGILVIAGLPYILVAAAGAAAIAGTAAAVYQVGKGIQKAEKRHQETVDLEKCSEQLARQNWICKMPDSIRVHWNRCRL